MKGDLPSMTKKTSKKSNKKGHDEEWSWEETSETRKAIVRLHDTIRQLRLEEDQDDKFNYDTSGK